MKKNGEWIVRVNLAKVHSGIAHNNLRKVRKSNNTINLNP